MEFYEYQPFFPLSTAIEKVWYCNSNNNLQAVTSFPLLNEEIVIDFSDFYEVTSAENKNLATENSIWISGLQTKPAVTKFEGSHKQYGILFKPGGLYMLFGVSAADITQKSYRLEELFGVNINDLKEFLSKSLDINQNLRVIALFMLKSAKMRPVHSVLMNAITIQESWHSNRGILKNYIDQIDISSKSFIKNFKKVFGVTPKKFFHIRQVNNVLTEMHSNKLDSLTHIGLNNGFYDQSHFIRVFKSFVQLTPKEYKLEITKGNISSDLPNYLNHQG